ncbi:MAG TPA: hypothetical protein VEG29_07380 [Candidatus Binatia bacterium]|nr:hypothetical protein [Candidatus Binatia bacterium]
MDRDRRTRAALGALMAGFLVAAAVIGADALTAPERAAHAQGGGTTLDALETAEPSETAEAAETPEAVERHDADETAEPSETPQASETPEVNETPEAHQDHGTTTTGIEDGDAQGQDEDGPGDDAAEHAHAAPTATPDRHDGQGHDGSDGSGTGGGHDGGHDGGSDD